MPGSEEGVGSTSVFACVRGEGVSVIVIRRERRDNAGGI